jgi:hypothetical protein
MEFDLAGGASVVSPIAMAIPHWIAVQSFFYWGPCTCSRSTLRPDLPDLSTPAQKQAKCTPQFDLPITICRTLLKLIGSKSEQSAQLRHSSA